MPKQSQPSDVPLSEVPAGQRRACVDHYLDQLCRLVHRAAACSVDPHRGDEFLWHVRRALECILAAVLEHKGYSATNSARATLSDFETLRQSALKVARVEMAGDGAYDKLFEVVQANANRANHGVSFQQRTSAASASNPAGSTHMGGVEIVRPLFGKLVRWLFRYVQQSEKHVERSLRVIEQGAPVGERSKWLSFVPWLVAVVAVIALIAVLVGNSMGTLNAPNNSHSSAAADAALSVSPVASIAAPNAVEPSTATVAVRPMVRGMPQPVIRAQNAGLCPVGTAFVEAPQTVVNPPRFQDAPRARWRDGLERGTIISQRYCVELSLVSIDQYAQFLREVPERSHRFTSEISVNSVCASANRGSPRRCVRRDEARAYCRYRYPANSDHIEGTLTSVELWEVLGRHRELLPHQNFAELPDDVATDSERRQGEWVGDDVPPSLWAPPGTPTHSAIAMWRMSGMIRDDDSYEATHGWNTRDQNAARFERIGFRCMFVFGDAVANAGN